MRAYKVALSFVLLGSSAVCAIAGGMEQALEPPVVRLPEQLHQTALAFNAHLEAWSRLGPDAEPQRMAQTLVQRLNGSQATNAHRAAAALLIHTLQYPASPTVTRLFNAVGGAGHATKIHPHFATIRQRLQEDTATRQTLLNQLAPLGEQLSSVGLPSDSLFYTQWRTTLDHFFAGEQESPGAPEVAVESDAGQQSSRPLDPFFFKGTIFAPAVVAREREKAARQPTIGFELNYTVGYFKDGRFVLRSGIEAELNQLIERGYRIAFWTNLPRQDVERALNDNLTLLRDLEPESIITRENFYPGYNDPRPLPATMPSHYTAYELAAMQSAYPNVNMATIISYYEREASRQRYPQDIALFGWQMLVNHTLSGIVDWVYQSPSQQFNYLVMLELSSPQIQSYRSHFDSPGLCLNPNNSTGLAAKIDALVRRGPPEIHSRTNFFYPQVATPKPAR